MDTFKKWRQRVAHIYYLPSAKPACSTFNTWSEPYIRRRLDSLELKNAQNQKRGIYTKSEKRT